MSKKPSRKTLRNKADALFSKQIRELGYCERCGKKAGEVQLQCAHWISRLYGHTRVVADNAFCLCAGCHMWFGLNPTEFGRWAIDKRGETTYLELRERSQLTGKVDWASELARLEDG